MSSYFLIRGSDPAGSDRVEVSSEMIVGRSDACQLIVQEGHPSRRHARLSIEGGALWIEDLESANGTFVNDRPVKTRTQLHDRDKVAFDLAVFVVAAPQAAQADDATVLRSAPVDPEATVLRPHLAEPPAADVPAAAAPAAPASAPASEPPPAQAASAPRTDPPAPAGAASTAASAAQQVPRSWADPEFQPEGATRMLTAAELQALAAGTAPGTTPAVDIGEPHLLVVAGKAAGVVLQFPAGPGEWSIGTDDARSLKLEDPGISAFHAKISHDNGRWRVIDQMSANGTFVNEEKITVSYLKDGDRIRFAQVECAFRLPSGKKRKVGKAKAAGGAKAAGTGGGSSRNWLLTAAAAAVTAAALIAASYFI
jgi:pSer/pThr/pTyr-binding forkhead associated (FHA) protein